ncbi:glycosyl hydrolase family 28-related protein [Selenomonas ruminantium]|uniref:glycosyl hydrolase family 28-related protein n=1 Tax=Selenomonas ruminantium TaxID=971 RepID=UPI0026EFE60D|nr:glycosyl hydrolase family 28-related protein [Selenomonas ruminantium]
MSHWAGGVLTAAGRELQVKVEGGVTLKLTKIKLGDGTESMAAVDGMVDLISPKAVLGISSAVAEGDVCTVTGVLSATQLSSGFYCREWGLFAEDPDVGEILFMITIDSQPEWLPASTEAAEVAATYAMNVAVANAENIEVNIDPAGLVDVDMLNKRLGGADREKAYTSGTIVSMNGLPALYYLKCITPGTTAAVTPVIPANVQIGDTITDGNVIWQVIAAVTDEDLATTNLALAESTGYGIVSGLQVKAQSTPNMTVSIEGGTVHMKNGTRIVIAAIAALTIATADATNPRIDSIYVDGTGNVAYAQGTPAATPVAPTLSTDAIKLADVNVAANQSSVTDANIIRNGEVKARYQNAGVVDVKDFGAKGDGVTDDTAAIQEAIRAAESLSVSTQNMHRVFIPAGDYVVNGTLDINISNAQILGTPATTIIFTPNNASSVLFNVHGVDVTAKRVTYAIESISYLKLYSTVPQQGIAFNMGTADSFDSYGTSPITDHVIISRFNIAYCHHANVYMTTYKNVNVLECNTFIKIDTDAANSGEKIIISGGFVNALNYAFDIQRNTHQLYIENVSFDAGAYLLKASGYTVSNLETYEFNQCHFEPNTNLSKDKPYISIEADGGGTVIMNNCTLVHLADWTADFAFFIDNTTSAPYYSKIILNNCALAVGNTATKFLSNMHTHFYNVSCTNRLLAIAPESIFANDGTTNHDKISIIYENGNWLSFDESRMSTSNITITADSINYPTGVGAANKSWKIKFNADTNGARILLTVPTTYKNSYRGNMQLYIPTAISAGTFTLMRVAVANTKVVNYGAGPLSKTNWSDFSAGSWTKIGVSDAFRANTPVADGVAKIGYALLLEGTIPAGTEIYVSSVMMMGS